MPKLADDNLSPWQLWPETEAALQGAIDAVLEAVPEARNFARQLERTTSTRVLDWIDHLELSGGEMAQRRLEALGFEVENVAVPHETLSFHHPGAQFPRVLVSGGGDHLEPIAIALKCDRVADVLLANGMNRPIYGARRSLFRQATLFRNRRKALRIIERCGYRGYMPVPLTSRGVERYEAVQEMWRSARPRL